MLKPSPRENLPRIQRISAPDYAMLSGDMDETRPSKLKDMLATVGAVCLALTLAGHSVSLFEPLGLRVAGSLASYSGLLALYAFCTAPGWRTPIPVFIVGALLYPVLFVLVLMGYRLLGSAVFHLFAGINVGVQFHGGADTPIEAYLGPWLANFILPILVVIGAKDFIRYRRSH